MARILKKDYLWSLYSGDRFVDVGTLEELSERNNMSITNLLWLSCPSAERRKLNMKVSKVCRLDDIEENA